jgi:hypothetical protein
LFALHQFEANVNNNCFATHYHWVKSGDLFLCFGYHKENVEIWSSELNSVCVKMLIKNFVEEGTILTFQNKKFFF